MKKIAITLLLITALLSACGKAATPEHTPGMDHSAHNANSASSSADGQAKAVFTLSDSKTQPNQDTVITIQILDKDEKPIDKFDISHEKQMHLIVVSQDLSFFNHIHPDYKGSGKFTVTTQFPTAGEFKVIADFTPTGMGALNKSQWVTIQGSTPAAKPIEPEKSLTKVVDGKEVTLSFDPLTPNKELSINFNIKDAETKKPVTDLQPYLGAVGHVVILSQDANNYLHVHPTDEKEKGPDAKFMTSFPHSGVYKIWGQFQHNGKVITVPFVVKVP